MPNIYKKEIRKGANTFSPHCIFKLFAMLFFCVEITDDSRGYCGFSNEARKATVSACPSVSCLGEIKYQINHSPVNIAYIHIFWTALISRSC